ncbi:helix-turn-helix domain-containing protein [Bacillus sp. EB106-08-02-XG196]|uniref:helix-turn-helix domain-containing protein n=1 Tax=Bacillus sp. EB106-08-02-XG196 TaxID=2737049 RepID=UPI0015C46178|nr:helix-turn-helix domain-containing protein [Bacillus sp. EB106-08-02-XG196]NWQ40734.1 helix-turn-helix domain-containing protein [Bacillus sp. EB106-08-02-XG196]
MFDRLEKITVFRKFLLSYLLILVIPLLASLIIYQVSIHKISENATENSKNLLNQTKEIIDQKNDEIEKFVYQMSLNPEINQLMNRTSSTDLNIAYDIYKVQNSISPYWLTNQLFRNFYIYFNQIDTIVSPESSYVRIKDYYNTHVYEGLSYDKWKKDINQTYLSRYYLPSTKVKMGETTEPIITYVQSLPFNNKENPKANIVVMINESEITTLLNRISSQYDGSTFILDDKGNLIAGDNMDKNLISFEKSTGEFSIKEHDKKYMYIETKSKNNKWTYVAVISKEKLSEDVNFIQTISSALAFFTIIVGLFTALLFSYKNSIPLNRLLGMMKITDIGKGTDPYDFIHSNVEEIIARNDRLKDQIQDQLPLLQDSLLRKLVAGEITSSKEARALMEQANIPLKGSFGYVGVVQIIHMLNELDKDMLDEMNVAQLFIQNEFTEIFKGRVLLSNIDKDQVLFLLPYDKKISSQETKQLEENLNLFIKQIAKKYSLKVNIGIGSSFEQLTEIHQAFEEAKLSLPFIQSIHRQGSVYKYQHQYQECNIDYYYPIEIELRLINAMKNGELNEVKELLDKIIIENVEVRTLTYQLGNQLLTALKGTIVRILSKNTQLNTVMVDEIRNRLDEQLTKKGSFEKSIEEIKEMVTEIALSIYESKSAGKQQVITRMKEWIKQNYHDPNLTLYKISEAVSLPEKMVPLIFKEHVGVNISDYIEDVRINFAKTNLTHSDDSIEEIAMLSGYNSAHSFRRAFKRNTGSSPSEYRKMLKET